MKLYLITEPPFDGKHQTVIRFYKPHPDFPEDEEYVICTLEAMQKLLDFAAAWAEDKIEMRLSRDVVEILKFFEKEYPAQENGARMNNLDVENALDERRLLAPKSGVGENSVEREAQYPTGKNTPPLSSHTQEQFAKLQRIPSTVSEAVGKSHERRNRKHGY